MKKKSIKNLLLGVLLLLVVFVIVKLIPGKKEAPVSLETTLVETGDVTSVVTATGTIEPTKQVEVGTQVSGVVKKVYVDYNSVVKAGQLIAELDKTTLLSVLAEAKASYRMAQNEQSYLQKIYERQKGLFANNLISEADYEEALYKLNAAKGTTEQRLSDLEKAETNLSYASIYSPIDGVVLGIDVEEGQTVAASFSTPTLFTIAQDLTKMQVEADVDEADIGNVQTGQRVTFTVDAYPEEEFAGTVTQVRLNPTVTSNVVTYTVVVKADNPEQRLKPGLTATINIFTKELKNVLTVKEKALAFVPDQELLNTYYKQHQIHAGSGTSKKSTATEKYVWIVQKNGELAQQSVKIGDSDGIQAQVLSGLTKNDKIATSITAVSEEAVAASGGSPFMPKPPGKKK
ncbi:efflux RND transporter periplasmic adaptor subunit [Fluviicola sp.]|uniref:efflux RND transporter periplasmic adaptor subunit n=1 Tax=Fluviicola sp. TaxID=1917219 RepID=UPI0031E31F4C